MYPNSKMIIGDINNEDVKNSFINSIGDDVKFLIATPPCQGMSSAGLQKKDDARNRLIIDAVEIIKSKTRTGISKTSKAVLNILFWQSLFFRLTKSGVDAKIAIIITAKPRKISV